MVEKEVKEFYRQNIQEGISINTVWEASKAYFRGITIRFAIRQGKEKSQKFKDLKEGNVFGPWHGHEVMSL